MKGDNFVAFTTHTYTHATHTLHETEKTGREPKGRMQRASEKGERKKQGEEEDADRVASVWRGVVFLGGLGGEGDGKEAGKGQHLHGNYLPSERRQTMGVWIEACTYIQRA